MAKVPFTVSARAARLIGRENVATSQGAVTELVKNAYDADASVCLVLFTRRWRSMPAFLSTSELRVLVRAHDDAASLLEERDGLWYPASDISAAKLKLLEQYINDVVDLWVVDNGHGMSAKVIETQWMVIGTDTKELNEESRSGRIVTGAKGIGRFALDRLGQESELYSAEEGRRDVAHWLVDWAAFEGAGKTISDVEAVLETEARALSDIYRSISLEEKFPCQLPLRTGEVRPLSFEHGTAIRISLLNDNWDVQDSLKLRETLDALLPPDDRADFNIYIHDERSGDLGAFIDNVPPDQFDYRMEAEVGADGDVSVTLTRQEIDAKKIRPEFYSQPAIGKFPYSEADFESGKVTYKTTLAKFARDNESKLQDYLLIGPFSFVLYFFKLNNPTNDNLKKYPQKNFDVGRRRRWLNSSGGIRLYRDGFRVRPYGEPRTPSSDWLLLGERSARNPAQASRQDWRVPPQQVAGTVNISKKANSLLADQSNREGIMNDRAFLAFREIILLLVREFEKDRSYILHNFAKAYDDAHPVEEDATEGKLIAERVLKHANKFEKRKGEDQQPGGKSSSNGTTEDLEKVSIAFNEQRKENDSLRDHLQVMRGMATLGTVLVSFTHELKQIKASIDSRGKRLSSSIEMVVDKSKLEAVPTAFRPSALIERMSIEDEKVSRWVNFALSAVSPAKRRRRRVDVQQYCAGLKSYWGDFLLSRSIDLKITEALDSSTAILAHEIDLDSIFYNLINNSVEALVKPSEEKQREISILVSSSGSQVKFDYSDNGPGLPKELNHPDDIFLFGVSSKKEESSGAAVGTGLGMWLLKNVVHDYRGDVILTCGVGEPGFSIAINIPINSKT